MIESILRIFGLFGESDQLLFKSPLSWYVFILLFLVAGGLVWRFYRRTIVPVSSRTRLLLVSLKTIPLLLILFCLMEPVAVTSDVTPQQGFLLLLFDDSKSMDIQDETNGVSRRQAVQKIFNEQRIMEAFEERFKVRSFRFSSGADRLAALSELKADGGMTNMAAGLSQAASEFRDMPLAGLVMITDGADNASADLAGTISYFKSQKIPIFTVGVGKEQIDRDIEILKVATARTVATGSVTDVFVTVRSFGFEGQTVDLHIREGASTIRSEPVRLGRDGDTQRIKLTLSPDTPGIFEYTAEIQPEPSEMIVENNTRRFLIDNRSRTARLLYVEGYPRKEFKFIRRALEEDAQVHLVSMVRISPDGRLYRQGIQNPGELQEGYPRSRRELFSYDAIIFGDIEASWFAPEQLSMTEAFVNTRGGGFLMLGGDRSFEENGYTGTPIEDALPVQIRAGSGSWGSPVVQRDFKLKLTPDGRNHPLMRLDQDPEKNLQLWEAMPELTGYNRTGTLKPGAAALGIDPGSDLLEGSNTILAVQRYGKGRSMILTAPSTWRWQMLMPSQDLSHERFWQQTARWLSLSSPGQVTVALDKEGYAENEPVKITAQVFNEVYEPVNDASVWAQVTGPTGESQAIPLEWTFGEGGTYRAEYHPSIGGMYRVDVSVRAPEAIAASDQAGFSVKTSVAEFTDATLHADALRQLAGTTGGTYTPLNRVATLPEQIPPVKQSSSTTRERDLRDTPLIFAAILLFLGAEWFLRRQKGLA